MKLTRLITTKITARCTCALLLIIIAALPVFAQNFQKAKIQIDLNKLADKASEVVEVTVEAQTLKLAAKFLKDSDPEEAAVKALINGLQGVYVRVYQFDKENEYSSTDVEGLRAQLRGPGWTRLVGVTSKREGVKVEVYTMYEGDKMLGLAIIAAEPKELVVVNIVGPIDLDKLSRLEGKIGLPKLDLKSGSKK